MSIIRSHVQSMELNPLTILGASSVYTWLRSDTVTKYYSSKWYVENWTDKSNHGHPAWRSDGYPEWADGGAHNGTSYFLEAPACGTITPGTRHCVVMTMETNGDLSVLMDNNPEVTYAATALPTDVVASEQLLVGANSWGSGIEGTINALILCDGAESVSNRTALLDYLKLLP